MRTVEIEYLFSAALIRVISYGSYIPPDPKPGGYNLCL